MAYCLNPECPHKKKIGRPAEFRDGFTHCSDCGSLLSEEIIEKEDTRKTSGRITFTDFHKRVLYTIGLIFLWRILLLIPAPGIDLQALRSLLGDFGFNSIFIFFGLGSAPGRLSVFALGVMPYISAYIIVEILSVFIQPLKSWRNEGYQGRMKIKRVALIATFLLTLLEGYGVAQGLEGMLGPVGEKIVRNPGLSFRLISALSLTGGTFLTIWIAELITKKGIGHGISILILVGDGPRIFSNIPQIKLVSYAYSPLAYFLFFTIIVVAFTALIVLMEKSYRKISVRFSDGAEAYISLKLSSAGIMPVEWTSTLIILPTALLLLIKNITHLNLGLPESLMPSGIWYYVIYCTITVSLYYLFTSFFYDTKKIATFLKNRQATIVSPPGKNEESYVDRSLESMIPIAVVYLCVVLFVPNAIFDLFLDFHLDSIGLIVAVAILFDLTEGIRLRRGNNLVKVAELHDVPMAGLVKSLFGQKGIPCYLRGYYHRALLYFFGPYIEISVLVPEDRVTDAAEVTENYLDANMLTVLSQ